MSSFLEVGSSTMMANLSTFDGNLTSPTGSPADTSPRLDLDLDVGETFLDAGNASNCTNDYCVSDEDYIDMIVNHIFPTRYEWALIAMHCVVFIVGLVGNALVCVAVYRNHTMRTVTNYFLVNLSVADLLMSLLNCTFNFIFMINSDWPFGAGYCTVNNFISHATVAASSFTLVAISTDRYMAIVRPLQHSLSRKKARIAVVVVWVSSTSLAVPSLLYSTTKTRRYAGEQTRTVCYMEWPDGAFPNSLIEYIYNIVFLGLTYLVPVTVMLVCYTRMALELWGSKSVGEMTQRQFESIQAKRKVILMFIIVVSIFAICWLPYHGFFIYSYHNTALTRANYVQHVYLAFYWFGMANAMVNPAIYYWMNSRFRLYFKQVLCLRCCARGKDSEMFNLQSTKMSHSTMSRSKSANSKKGAENAVPWSARRLQTQEVHISDIAVMAAS
uniref:Tachykinin-Like peptides receptor isoform X2 n=1 Tax=Carausius morosus TaxID=7022 RepID=A0A891XIE1_CARMO|nr:tachykinin-Like peptides receptor isoform X2 [Carausius morosus]